MIRDNTTEGAQHDRCEPNLRVLRLEYVKALRRKI